MCINLFNYWDKVIYKFKQIFALPTTAPFQYYIFHSQLCPTSSGLAAIISELTPSLLCLAALNILTIMGKIYSVGHVIKYCWLYDINCLKNDGIIRCLQLSRCQLISCSANICCIVIRAGLCPASFMLCLVFLNSVVVCHCLY